ncbi:MAG: glycosyltransferase [Burkholderiaceae bacterium]
MLDRSSFRVGYVLKRFPRFSETFVVNEILALERAGVHVEVFSLRDPDEPMRHEMLDEVRAPVHRLKTYDGRDPLHDLEPFDDPHWRSALNAEPDAHPIWAAHSGSAILRLRRQAGWIARIARERRLAHLHAHFGSDAATAAMIAARAARIDFSFTAHARDIYHCYVDPETDALARCHKMAAARFVSTVTEFNRLHLESLTAGTAADIRLLYNGVDLDRFAPGPVSAQADNRILAIGRLVAKKGFSDLIDACASLRSRDLAFRCDIIGEGPLRSALQGRIDAMKLDDCVRLVGPRTQAALIEEIRSATVTALPCVVDDSGDRDALPTVLIESLAMGVPVVTTRVNGCPEIVGDQEAGWLVAPNDSSALADALADALLDAPERAARGRRGRQRCARRFDVHRNARLLAQWFGVSALPNPTRATPMVTN